MVLAVIELDDQSHRRRNRQQRDSFLREICTEIGLPLLQVPAQRVHSVATLRDTLQELLGSPPMLEPPGVDRSE